MDQGGVICTVGLCLNRGGGARALGKTMQSKQGVINRYAPTLRLLLAATVHVRQPLCPLKLALHITPQPGTGKGTKKQRYCPIHNLIHLPQRSQ